MERQPVCLVGLVPGESHSGDFGEHTRAHTHTVQFIYAIAIWVKTIFFFSPLPISVIMAIHPSMLRVSVCVKQNHPTPPPKGVVVVVGFCCWCVGGVCVGVLGCVRPVRLALDRRGEEGWFYRFSLTRTTHLPYCYCVYFSERESSNKQRRSRKHSGQARERSGVCVCVSGSAALALGVRNTTCLLYNAVQKCL